MTDGLKDCIKNIQLMKFTSNRTNKISLQRLFTLTSFSESPLHLLTILDAEILKNVVLHSVAMALASNVFPVPVKKIIIIFYCGIDIKNEKFFQPCLQLNIKGNELHKKYKHMYIDKFYKRHLSNVDN